MTAETITTAPTTREDILAWLAEIAELTQPDSTGRANKRWIESR